MKRRSFLGVVVGGLCSLAGMGRTASEGTPKCPDIAWAKGFPCIDERGETTGIWVVESPRSLANCSTVEEARVEALRGGWYQATHTPHEQPDRNFIESRMACTTSKQS